MPTPRAYYNEFDVKAAAWLRELIKAGHIAPGDVDDRSIADVAAADLKGYTQCHFFAGIGGWSYALRLARWPDDRPVWTGSCPCQPFSAAGKRGGTDDTRHLWPEFYRLIGECRPATVFGEQVASKDGLAWLDIVSTDLERADYAIGAAGMCAAGIGAPHIRQRLYFVGHASGQRQPQCGVQLWQSESSENGVRGVPKASGRSATYRTIERSDLEQANPEFGNMEHAEGDGPIERRPESGRWSVIGGCEFIPCRDGKARPIESGTFPLAHGVPHRVGLLRGYGNAIVPQVAAEFIGAYLDIVG